MDVFEYMRADEANLSQGFVDTTENYSVWPRDRVFEESKRLLDGVTNLFEKEKLLSENIEIMGGFRELIQTASKQREEILGETENLVMIHVDEPGFESGLESISDKLRNHIKYCDETFYPNVKAQISAEQCNTVYEQMQAHFSP